MKLGIKWKVLPIIAIGAALTVALSVNVFTASQHEALSKTNLDVIQSSQKTFYNLVKNDTKLLQSAMTDFMTNQEYKNLFMAGDREKLYEATKDLYAKHKELGITHFYFHSLSDTIFARIHSIGKFDDKLTRITYLKSKEANSWGTGIELGQTAFALRAVHPYYNGNDLIGYVEFGEEIDHFLKIMKEQTDHNYATIVKKDFINEASWKSVTETKGIRNNYNDLPGYVVIDSTDASMIKADNKCWDENKIAKVTKEGNVFATYIENGKTFACGGFALYDAADRNVGAVVTVRDITSEVALSNRNLNKNIILISLISLAILLVVLLFINIVIISPVKKLREAVNKVTDGDFETPLPSAKSGDEISDLIGSMEMLISILKTKKKK